MKKKTFIAIVVLLMCCNQIQCQETKKESKLIHLLQIESDCIYPPLDRAISLFDSIESKNDTLLFFIDIVKRPQDSIYMLQIEYENNIDFCFNYFIPVYGYFYYQNCLFIVSGLDSEIIFSKKDIMTRFEYVPDSDDQLVIIDDSRPYWVYYYLNDRFVLYGESIPDEYRNQQDK